MTQETVAFLVALLPGLYTWLAGKRLRRHVGHAAFPQLKVAHSKRLASCTSLVIVTLLFLSLPLLPSTLSLLLLGNLAGGFPLRKKLLGETWSFPSFLGHQIRLILAFGSPWILVILAAALLYFSGAFLLPATLLLLATVVSWLLATPWLAPRLLGGQRVTAPELEEPFRKVLAAARCPPPRLIAIPWGGRVTNAFALASATPRGTVLFTEGLLQALTPAQSAAILAHEVAHLEQWGRKRMVIAAVQMAVLVLLAAAVTVVFPEEQGHRSSLSLAWTLVVCLALILSLSARKKAEHQSDLRALELGASPDDLIEALTILHQRLGVPRQWDEQTERGSSHPSLARRIQAIRRAARVPDEHGLEPLLIRSGSRGVLFEEHQILWLDGLPPGPILEDDGAAREAARTVTSMAYDEVRSLYLDSSLRGMTLRCGDGAGRKWKLPVAANDIERLQDALGKVDHRLGGADEGGALFTPAGRSPLRRVLGVLGAFLGLLPGISWAAFLSSLLVALRPNRATLAAAVTASLGGAALAYFRASGSDLLGREWALFLSFTQLLMGLLFLLFLVPRLRAPRPSPRPRFSPGLTILVLGGGAILSLVGLLGRLAGPLPLTHLHLWASTATTLPLALLAISAALVVTLEGSRRWASLLAALPAVAVLAFSSAPAAERLTDDSFRFRGAELDIQDVPLEAVRSATFEGSAAGIAISPGGRRVALQAYDEESYNGVSEDTAPSTYLIEQDDGSWQPWEALAVSFVDDDRILTLQRQSGELALRLLPAEGSAEALPRELWRLPLPNLSMAVLSVRGDRWQVTGSRRAELIDSPQGTLDGGVGTHYAVCLSGEVGSDDVRSERWALPASHESTAADWWAGSGLGVLSLRFHWAGQGFVPFAFQITGRVPQPWDSELSWWNDREVPEPQTYRSAHSLQVLPPAPGDAAFRWQVTSGAVANLWQLRPGQEPTPTLRLPAAGRSLQRAGGDRLLIHAHPLPLVIDPSRGKSFRLLLPPVESQEPSPKEPRAFPSGPLAVHGSYVATATTHSRTGQVTIEIYRMPEPGDS